MATSRLLSLHRGLDDEPRCLDEILLLGRTHRQPLFDVGEHGAGSTEALGCARNARVLPHQRPNRIGAHLCGSPIGEHGHLPLTHRRLGAEWLDRRDVARDALGEDKAFEQ